jgi:hypothetical protein
LNFGGHVGAGPPLLGYYSRYTDVKVGTEISSPPVSLGASWGVSQFMLFPVDGFDSPSREVFLTYFLPIGSPNTPYRRITIGVEEAYKEGERIWGIYGEFGIPLIPPITGNRHDRDHGFLFIRATRGFEGSLNDESATLSSVVIGVKFWFISLSPHGIGFPAFRWLKEHPNQQEEQKEDQQ